MRVSNLLKICFVLFITTLILSCSKQALTDPEISVCDILKENPQWSKSLKEAQTKYNLPPQFAMSIIYQESKFIGTAKSKSSSAYGYAQAIDGTWKVFQNEVNSSAKRDNFNDSVQFIGWYMSDLSKRLKLNMTDSYSLYMAYMLGQTGYKRYKAGTYANKEVVHKNESIASKVKARADLYNKQFRNCKIK
ncbi:transglycosylase SLT domain-containing protein [Pseudofrancisella aestuarii]|uniref:Transglycosylase SLT domain-containing protein n=1 Tax=Pseudofrancisella aestuarii TaxID=2670347 RepID=A0ABV9TDG9_9GAMM|nr:transglycosylase SLT domain-containing protein [Pseudofrancisella aestuarii]